jgi:hypothetical protein
MKLVVPLILSMAVFGCVADPETKVASSQTAVALSSLGEAEESFKRLYLQELDKTRDLVKRSLVARAVVDKVKELANDLEEKGDLITLSMELEGTDAAVRGLIDEVEDEAMAQDESKEKKDKDVREQLGEFVKKKRKAILETAQLLPAENPTRKELEAKAGAAELISKKILDQLFVLMQLKLMRAEAAKGLQDLRDHIANLQAVHTTIDQWIQTDVKASGEDVAKLVDKHAKTLGFVGKDLQ